MEESPPPSFPDLVCESPPESWTANADDWWAAEMEWAEEDTCSRWAVQQDTLRWLDPQIFESIFVGDREYNSFYQLLDLLV